MKINTQLVLKLVHYLKPYWLKELVIAILIVLSSLLSLSSPYLTKIIIDDVFPNKDFELLLFVLAVFLCIFALTSISRFFLDYLYAWVSNRIALDIRRDFFNRLIHLPMSFYHRHQSGDLVHRINNDILIVQGTLASSIFRIIHITLTACALVVVLSLLSLELLPLALLTIPFIAVITQVFRPKITNVTERVQQKNADILNFFKERFENIELVKMYQGFQYEDRHMRSKVEELIGFNMKNVVYSSSMRSSSFFLMALTPIILYGAGGYQVIYGNMTIGTLLAFVQYSIQLFSPFRELLSLYTDFLHASVSARRVFEFMDESPTKVNGTVAKSSSYTGDLALANVSFAYNGTTVLNNASMRFEKNKTYALVGHSGCGKSTVVGLLCRLYEPSSGMVCFDGVDIRQFEVTDWQQKISLVSQTSHLFHDTLYENLRYGSWQKEDKEVERAADIVGLQGQVDVVIGDSGNQLSGGQKQRIAIGRALLKDSEVLILDEATSALDPDGERSLLSDIISASNNKTIIIVSHRLSAIRKVDEIICLDYGKVKERGSHRELVSTRGFYWSLFNSQL